MGHVFQGRYKAIICERDEYLLELIRYIHLNPVRAGIVKSPEQYRYSGHGIYLGGKPTEVLDPTKILRLLGGKGAYRSFVQDGIGEGHKEEYYEVEDQRFLGGEGFGDNVERRVGKGQEAEHRRPLQGVLKELAKKLEIEVEVLRSPDRSWAVSKARTVVAYVLVRRLGYKLGEVAGYLRRDMATVGTLMARLSERIQSDRQLQGKVERLSRIVEL
jgi:hypothetical protein